MSLSTATKRVLWLLLALVISVGAVTKINLATDVRGLLAVANAGTGAATASANTVLAGPTSGGAVAYAFRTLVAGDIPALSAAILTSGTLDNARLVAVPNSALANSSTTVNGTTCTLGSTCTISVGSATFPFPGDGSDNALVFDGSSTVLGIVPSGSKYYLTRDIYATTLTVNSGVTVSTANYAVFATTSATINGTLENSGAVGSTGNNGSSGSGGGQVSGGQTTDNNLSSSGSYSFSDPNGQNGQAGANGTTTNGAQPGTPTAGSGNTGPGVNGGSAGLAGQAGGKGGDSGANVGGAAKNGGSAGALTALRNNLRSAQAFTQRNYRPDANALGYQVKSAYHGAAAGGSSGAGDGSFAGSGGGSGGGGGGHGGFLSLAAPIITVGASGTIASNGGAAGPGGNGATQAVGNLAGGGGGAGGNGGNGGFVFLAYHTLTNSGSITASGGALGNGGAKGLPHGTATDNATAGSPGIAGRAGEVLQFVF